MSGVDAGHGKVLHEEADIGDGAGNGAWITLPPKTKPNQEVIVQIDITGGSAGTFQVQGRVDSDMDPVDMLDTAQEFGTSALYALAWVPQMRLEWDGDVAGDPDVLAKVYHG
jgi:hypothetical protein